MAGRSNKASIDARGTLTAGQNLFVPFRGQTKLTIGSDLHRLHALAIAHAVAGVEDDLVTGGETL